MATNYINTAFEKLFPLNSFTAHIAKLVIEYVRRYEMQDSHPAAFNTYTLGIHKCYFKNSDRDAFLGIFNLTIGDIRKVTGKLPSVNQNFKVVSDPLNLFITYTIHGLLTSPAVKSYGDQHTAVVLAIKLLQYKFFTSLVNYYFPYAPNEDIMRAMFEKLQYKYEIKVHETWANVMNARAEQLLEKSSIHLNTLIDFNNDKSILYFISDIQTRIRSQMKTIWAAFHEAKENHDAMMTYGSLGTNSEGETSLLDKDLPVDSAATGVYADCLNLYSFLDPKLQAIAIGQFKNVNPVTFKSFLISFSEYCVKMHKAGKTKEIKRSEDYEIYVGPEIFITSLIRQCYRFCANNKIDTNRPLQVIKAIKDAFSSSRIADEDILKLRKTLEYYVLQLQANRREIIMSGLRIGFVIYIMLLTFKYTGVFGK